MSYEALKGGRITWTNIVDPTPDNMKRLEEAYPQFHPLDLEDCLSQIERPKIDEYDDYLFAVIPSILGMNVPYPLQTHPATFFGVPGVMLLISLIMLAIFHTRHWL